MLHRFTDYSWPTIICSAKIKMFWLPCRCEIYSLFNSPWFASNQSPNSGNSWVGGGLILADHCFKNKGLPCTNCTSNELVIAFTNSQIYGSGSSWCNGPSTGKGRPFYCAAVGTGTATYPNLSSQMQSGSIFLVGIILGLKLKTVFYRFALFNRK